MATSDIVNVIADALVTTLAAINGPAGGYVNTVKLCERVAPPDWSSKPRPYVAVTLGGVRTGEAAGEPGGFYRRRITYLADFVMDAGTPDLAGAERAGISMAEDITRAVALGNGQLGGALVTGWMWEESWEINVNPQGTVGLVAGRVTFECTVEWSS